MKSCKILFLLFYISQKNFVQAKKDSIKKPRVCHCFEGLETKTSTSMTDIGDSLYWWQSLTEGDFLPPLLKSHRCDDCLPQSLSLTYCCCQHHCSSENPKKPNVIILLSDDVGIGDLEVYNSKSKIKTPHLNKMARNGFRFLDAHSASSKCSPSRYMLLTGRYSLNSGLFHRLNRCWWRMLVTRSIPFWALTFRLPKCNQT